MNVKKILNIKNPISLVRYIDGKVGVIDNKNTFRIYSLESFKLIGGFKINLPENNPLENSVSISPKGNYLAIAIKGKNSATIWNVAQKKLMHTISWHKGEILTLSFDFDENYLLSGGMDGRAYLWSVELGKMVTSLPPHPDYILSGAFSKNSLWVATGSFDKMINITNISSLNITYRKKVHRGAVTQIKFLKSQKMISADKTGELIVWDYPKAKVISRLPNVADMVIDFDFDENESFMFVITKEKKIYLYDLENYELITDSFIKIGELPSSIAYVPENSTLWIGTLGGSVYIFDIFEDEKILGEVIERKDYAKAYEMVKENPFLKRSKLFKKLEEIWQKSINAAYRLMEKGAYNNAKQILSPFLAVSQKRSVIQNLLNDFAEFEKFKKAVISRKYPLAYSLVSKYPSFKDTAYYKKMEDDWRKVFNKAKELIKIKGKEDKVRELLMPFRGVPQKTPLIQALFNDKQLYDLLRSYILSKKFDDFFSLVSRYPFLYETPEYEQAIRFGERLSKVASKALKEGRFREAISYAQTLKAFPEYKEKAEDMIHRANVYSRFLNAIANNRYDLVEKMILEDPFLEESEDYERFQKNIASTFKKAEKEASSMDVKSAKKTLFNLANSNLFRNRAIGIIKTAYLNQLLDALIKKDANKVKNGIKNYIAYFGLDNEIEDILKMASKRGIKVDLKSYDKSKLIEFNTLPDFIWEEV